MSEENAENKQDDIQESDILDQFEQDLNKSNEEEKPQAKAPEEKPKQDETKEPSDDQPVEKRKTGLFDKNKKEAVDPEPEKQPEPEANNQPSDDDAPEHVTDKVGWKAMKKKHSEEISSKDAQIEELKAKLNQSSLNSPEYKQLQEEHEQMSKRLSEVDLKNSPEFQKKFVQPAERAQQRMLAILKEANLDQDHNLNTIFMQSERDQKNAIAEISDELGKFDGREFEDLYRDILRINYDATDALSNAEATNQQMMSESTYNMEKAVSDRWNEMTDSGGAFLSEILPDDPNSDADVKSANDYNNALGQILNNATQKSLGAMDERSLADAHLKAQIGDFIINHGIPRLEHEYNTLQSHADNLQAKLDKIERNNPQVNGMKAEEKANQQKQKTPETQEDVLDNFEREFKASFQG